MKDDKESYLNQGQAFKYIASVKHKQTLNIDSLKKYQNWLFNTTRLGQNNGRFEGFKVSGKIGTIEDKMLQNDIMDLYQENIPELLATTDPYLRIKNEWFDFNMKNSKRITDSTSNILTILHTDEAQNLCGLLANPVEIINRYDICINKAKTIITKIENQYSITHKNKD